MIYRGQVSTTHKRSLRVVNCAAGVCDRHAPGPGNPGGVQGLIFNMSTDPRCRRRGYARAWTRCQLRLAGPGARH